LSDADYQVLRRALAFRQPVRNAARTARGSAATILTIGVVSIPVSLFWPSWLGLCTVAGICTVGVVEYLGARRMQRGEMSAARFLATNQLAFLGLITTYCVIQMLTFSPTTLVSPEMQTQLGQLEGAGSDIQQMLRAWAPLATYGFYSLVISLSLCFQGGLAAYYLTRRRHLRAMQAATPSWVLRLFREMGV
jgi:hypothetical protein